MLPRTNGLQLLLDAFANTDVKPDVYDITIGYTGYTGEIPSYAMGYSRQRDTLLPNMFGLLAGDSPKRVHIHFTKHSYAKVVDNVQGFLDQQWQTKDELHDN